MVARVGPKGQVVIAKDIRDRLGIRPGWKAFQILVDDHVEIYFIPPEHHESLAGVLMPYIQTTVAPGDAWEQAQEQAWEEAIREGWERCQDSARADSARDEGG